MEKRSSDIDNSFYVGLGKSNVIFKQPKNANSLSKYKLFFYGSYIQTSLGLKLVIDRYWFFITDTDYLYIYVPDNRYA